MLLLIGRGARKLLPSVDLCLMALPVYLLPGCQHEAQQAGGVGGTGTVPHLGQPGEMNGMVHTSPHLTLLHLASSPLTSPHLTSPHLT